MVRIERIISGSTGEAGEEEQAVITSKQMEIICRLLRLLNLKFPMAAAETSTEAIYSKKKYPLSEDNI